MPNDERKSCDNKKWTLDRWRVKNKTKQSSLSRQQFYNQRRLYGKIARAVRMYKARWVYSFNVLKAQTVIALSYFFQGLDFFHSGNLLFSPG